MTNLRIHFAKPQWDSAELKAMEDVWCGAVRYDSQPITDGGKVAEFEDKFAEFCGGGCDGRGSHDAASSGSC